MKTSVILISLVNVILMLFCMESCCSIRIDRQLKDVSDRLDLNNCNSIFGAILEGEKCRCSQVSSILSTSTDKIGCVANGNIDSSKYS